MVVYLGILNFHIFKTCVLQKFLEKIVLRELAVVVILGPEIVIYHYLSDWLPCAATVEL